MEKCIKCGNEIKSVSSMKVCNKCYYEDTRDMFEEMVGPCTICGEEMSRGNMSPDGVTCLECFKKTD